MLVPPIRSIYVISESQDGDGSFIARDRGVVVMESTPHYLFKEKIEQDGSKQTTLTDAHYVLKKSTFCPLSSYALVAFPKSSEMTCTGPSSMLNPLITCQRPSCHKLSKAFLKPMKLWRRLRWCCRCFCNNNHAVKDLFNCTPHSSESSLLFGQQFIGLTFHSIKDDA
ncbi:hypothetical protein DPMN_193896 [Dreissena polymorpha]|uniref:Uncharacterized protein n=1 Tax=Dreissena polymorpha TaxID=45954 RepID=A0A9D3Y465_DREPO|nr:hypothetical protein DPMN_193896 [Dreissena polymorpha]